MNDRSKRLRLAAWIVAAIGASVGQTVWLEWMKFTSARMGWPFELGYVAILACVALIAGLLCTTPSNAILLPRWISELIIVAAVIGLALPGLQYFPITIGRLLFLLPALILLRVHEKSAWWAAVIAWFPIAHFAISICAVRVGFVP